MKETMEHAVDSVKEAFESTVKTIKDKAHLGPSENMVEMNALFKQATLGDCKSERPGMLDLKGKAEWDAWEKKKGMT